MNRQPERKRRRYLLWLSIIVVSLLLPIVVAAFKPLTFGRGTRQYELSAGILKPGDPFHGDRSGFFSTGWDGPTGEFSHGDIYGLKLGRLLVRFNMTEDPLGVARRRLPATLLGLVQSLESSDRWLRRCAAEALQQHGAAAVGALPALFKCYENGGLESAWVIEDIAKAGGAEAMPILIKALSSDSALVREKSATVLGEIGPPASAAEPALLASLNDPDPKVAVQSALALWRIVHRCEASLPVTTRLAANPSPQVRSTALFALGEFGGKAGAAALVVINALQDEDAQVQLLAVRACGSIGSAAELGINTLVQMLDRSNPLLTPWICQSLAQFGPKAKVAIPELRELALQDSPSAMCAIEALPAMGPEAVPVIIELYQHPANRHRAATARALGKCGEEAANAVPILMRDLDGTKASQVAMAAEALGNIGEPARPALPQIKALLSDEDGPVRLRAAHALWKLDKDRRAVLPVLLAGLEDASIFQSTAKRIAADAMAEIEPVSRESRPLLNQLLSDSQSSVRTAASNALARITERERTPTP